MNTTVKTKEISNIFVGLDKKETKVSKSQLTIIKTEVNKAVDGEVKSVSKYFAEFRKNFENINCWLKEANSKGRTFNPTVCHDILMNGKLSLLIEADKAITEARAKKATENGRKYSAPIQWSANRMFAAFVHAVEIK